MRRRGGGLFNLGRAIWIFLESLRTVSKLDNLLFPRRGLPDGDVESAWNASFSERRTNEPRPERDNTTAGVHERRDFPRCPARRPRELFRRDAATRGRSSVRAPTEAKLRLWRMSVRFGKLGLGGWALWADDRSSTAIGAVARAADMFGLLIAHSCRFEAEQGRLSLSRCENQWTKEPAPPRTTKEVVAHMERINAL